MTITIYNTVIAAHEATNEVSPHALANLLPDCKRIVLVI